MQAEESRSGTPPVSDRLMPTPALNQTAQQRRYAPPLGTLRASRSGRRLVLRYALIILRRAT